MVVDLNGGYVSVSVVGGNSVFVVGSLWEATICDRQFQTFQILRESIQQQRSHSNLSMLRVRVLKMYASILLQSKDLSLPFHRGYFRAFAK